MVPHMKFRTRNMIPRKILRSEDIDRFIVTKIP